MNLLRLERQAERGNYAAQTILGIHYLHGSNDIAIDYDRAHRFLAAAAEGGVSRAVSNLALMYAQGLGVPKDITRAVHLYESVGRVEFFAAIALGRIYSNGNDIPIDSKKAAEWYSVATTFRGKLNNCDDELEEAMTYIAHHPEIS